jgi:hypothetical protein|uniref:hypothetical protein n=1 Tax=Algoriphagus sp. TaxID=1872435 RepID=UPI004047E68C
MAFIEGHQKIGGRSKGTPNRLTKEFRILLKDILYKEVERIPEYLDSLEPKEKLEVIIKLLNFAIPKVQSVSPNEGEPIDFVF